MNATDDRKQKALEAEMEWAKVELLLETLETRKRDALDIHEIPVWSIKDLVRHAFEAGWTAATAEPAEPTEPEEMLATLKIKRLDRRTRSGVGGTWASGTIAGHAFEALVFPEHADNREWELGDSRISKLWLRHQKTRATVANFDRGWDVRPTNDTAARIVDLLAAGIAEHIFGA